MDLLYYEKDGVKYDRPTHILDHFPDPKLVDWKVKVGKKTAGLISRQALKIGSRVDELIRMGEKPKKADNDEVKNCMKAWEKWRERYPEPITFPNTAYCEARKIAGTPDFYMEESRILVDIKTSVAIRASYWLQVGGCYLSLPLPFAALDVAILRLDKKNGDYEFVKASDKGLDLDILRMGFNGAVNFYRVNQYIENLTKERKAINEGEDEDYGE